MSETLVTVQDTFDQWALEGQDARMEQGHWPTASQLIKCLDIKPGQWVLDIGCGNGYVIQWASEQVGSQGRAVGIDISPTMAAHAKLKLKETTNTSIMVADVQNMPFAPESFHHVVSVECLYYTSDVLSALQKIEFIMASGGQLAVMVDFYKDNPYCATWPELLGLPMAAYSEAEYRDLFEAAGFSQVETKRLYNPTPVDASSFTPGWGFNSVSDVEHFRQQVGSLAILGRKP